MLIKDFFKIITCMLILIFSVSANTPITQLSVATISVKEPSALSFNTNNTLLTVSDNNGSVYELSLEGKVLREIKTFSSDLEGIVAHPDLNGFCVVEERVRNVVCMDNHGNVIRKKSIPISGTNNSGFEGITYNSRTKQFYVVNEKEPTSIYVLSYDLKILETHSFNHALDLSDISYDEIHDRFFILSHESKAIYITDANFKLKETLSIPSVVQAEGIAYDEKNRKIYIVSDKDSKFIVFKYL